jgi:DsbC/DsbD-like thiol-disulfide interchange protein
MKYCYLFPSRFFCLVLLLFISQEGMADPVLTENAEVELVSEQTSVRPGETFWIGIRMDLREGWHTYWRNPGDSGMPMMLVVSSGTPAAGTKEAPAPWL